MSVSPSFQSIDVYSDDHGQAPSILEFALSDYDQLMTGNYTTPVCTFPYDGPRGVLIEQFRQGLQNVITEIPLLAGSLKNDGEKRLSVTRDRRQPVLLGVNFLDADATMPSYADLKAQDLPPAFFTQYAASLMPPEQDLAGLRRDDGCPVAAFQVNFLRGGVLVVVALHHCCGDARSIDHTFSLWAASTKAATEYRSPPKSRPYLDRTYFNASASVPKDQIEHVRASVRGYTFRKADDSLAEPQLPVQPPVTITMYHFSSAACSALKRLCMPSIQGDVPFVSSYDCIAGLTWRCMTRARLPCIESDLSTTTTGVSHAVDIRGRFDDIVPVEYFGNAFNMTTTKQITIKELVAEAHLPQAAHTVRRSIQSVQPQTIPDVLKLRRALAGEENMQWDFRLENIVFTSWAAMRPMQTYDFGFGLPDAMRLPVAPYGGVAGLLPASRNRDGVSDGFDVFVVLDSKSQGRMRSDKEWQEYCTIIGV